MAIRLFVILAISISVLAGCPGRQVEPVPQVEVAPVLVMSSPEHREIYLTYGGDLYAQRCAACHGPRGVGRREYFPTLRGNPFVTADPEAVVEVILQGRNLMPGFHDYLTDTDVAAVASYIRTAWGNEGDLVYPETVAEVR